MTKRKGATFKCTGIVVEAGSPPPAPAKPAYENLTLGEPYIVLAIRVSDLELLRRALRAYSEHGGVSRQQLDLSRRLDTELEFPPTEKPK